MRRAANFALSRPAREVLYTVVTPEQKYKAKNFIDTVIYRGGDAASGWAFAGLAGLGLELAAMALVAVPLAALWMAVASALGFAPGTAGPGRRGRAILISAGSHDPWLETVDKEMTEETVHPIQLKRAYEKAAAQDGTRASSSNACGPGA